MEPPAVVREGLLVATLAASPSTERVEVARVELGPGQAAGRHSHPCDVVGYVASGTIRFGLEDRPESTLEAGSAFHEPRDAIVAHFDNASATEPAVFIAFYLLPPREDRLIEMLD